MEHKIIQRDIDSLIFAEYNPRQLTKDQHQHLKDSIQRFGLVDPILVNKHKTRENIIIGGHQRVRVAKDLDIDKVPCIELSLTYEKERELNVRLNKNTGEWNWDELANSFDIAELTDWGFSESQLVGFSDLDYSILDDEEVDNEMEGMMDGTRKAIQIEFKLEDYEEAYKLIKKLRDNGEYVGGMMLETLKDIVMLKDYKE